MSDPTSYQPPPPPPPQYQAPAPAGSGLSDAATCGLAYMTFIPAVIFLVMAPYNQSREVRFHSWQSIFLTIGAVCIDILFMILRMLPFIGLLFGFLFVLVWVGLFILWLVVVINAFNGKRFSIPFIGDLAAKQAGA
ncbi:MAG: DUF4870 domain-containing protein [Terracidiphilus sp.]